MKKPNQSKVSGKKTTEIDELKKPVKLKPDNKKASKNWKNNLFEDEDDDDFMFDDLKSELDDDFENDFDDEAYEDDDDN